MRLTLNHAHRRTVLVTGGYELPGSYRFSSLTLKGLERRLDGLFEPKGHSGPVYVVEFQGSPRC